MILGTDAATATRTPASDKDSAGTDDVSSTGGGSGSEDGTGDGTGSDGGAAGSAGAGNADEATVSGVPPLSGEPREPVLTGQLVIDLRTLQGLNDDFALLDGSPIQAVVGRELARGIRTWRRMVTDPVTGHLLGYGRSQYLPEPLLR